MVAMAAGLCVALFGILYARKTADSENAARKQEEAEKEERQRKERELERQDRLAADSRNHEIFLNESIPCEGIGCAESSGLDFLGVKRLPRPARTHPRRQLWRLPDEAGGKAVCAGCFMHRTGVRPVEGKDKRAFT